MTLSQLPEASGKKSKAKRYLLLMVAVWLVAVLAFFLKPAAPLDLSKEEEPFKSMVLPLSKVGGATACGQGGEIVNIIDGGGRTFSIFFHPSWVVEWRMRPFGPLDGNYPKVGGRLKDGRRAVAVVVRLVEKHGQHSEADADVLRFISTRTEDRFRRLRWGIERLFR